MVNAICQRVRRELAVLALTREPIPDDLATHLQECTECATELAEMNVTVSVLDRVALSDLAEIDDQDSAALDRMLDAAIEVRRSQRHRAWALSAAASIVVVLVAVVVGLNLAGSSGPAPTQSTSSAVVQAAAHDAASGVSGHVVLTPTAAGSDVAFTITGVAPGTKCTLVAHGEDGWTSTAATWSANYAGAATVNGSLPHDPSSVTRIDVVDAETGQVLLPVTFT